MVKLLFLLRDYQLADASKRTRERTLRRWICHCTALCFVSQLHQHTVLCLTAIVLFLTGGSFELVSDSASDRYGTVGKFPLCLVANCVCVGLVLCWAPAPFSCCFAVGFCGETQIWLGDLRVVWCLGFCLLSWLLIAFATYFIVQLEPLRFSRLVLIRSLSAYTNYRTEPQSDIGQTSGKKIWQHVPQSGQSGSWQQPQPLLGGHGYYQHTRPLVLKLFQRDR